AAEAALETSLQRNSTDVSDLSFDGIASINAQLITDTSATFTTPLIQKDGQYTFFPSPYDESSEAISSTPYSGEITITTSMPNPSTYCTGDDTKFALELTFIDSSTTPPTSVRRLIDDCDIVEGTEHEWDFGTSYNLASEDIASTIFFMKVITQSSNFEGAKIVVSRSTGTWPLQGKTLISTAKTTTGVEKKIKLFQSYPQIPSDLFVTSF
ncbi:MAG: hypothetical protein ACMG6E_00895, partial [Candidatus Roizmanbacteria bacterium]